MKPCHARALGCLLAGASAVASATDVGLALGAAERATAPPNRPAREDRLNWIEFLDNQVTKRIAISGYRRLGYHLTWVTGDKTAFELDNFSGLGGQRFTDLGSITVSGARVFDTLTFNATIQDSRFRDPDNNRFLFEYTRGPWRANYGDLFGTLTNTNPYANLNRTLRGGSLEYKSGGFTAKALTSQARGQARTLSFSGNNSTGPYFLQSSQIIRGSETVRLDGVVLEAGRDYILTPEIGVIEFTRSVSPSSTVVVTFEVRGSNQEGGSVSGVGMSYDAKRAGRFGVTAIQQRAGSGRFLGSQRTELFQGFGAASTPYTLQFEPLDTRPITIRVDGIIQAEGADYVFDTLNPAVFFFRRFIPTTSEISVVYTPRPTGTVDGDREVYGADYRYPLGASGRNGTASLSYAVGRLKSPVNPQSGAAKGLDLFWNDGPATLTFRARDIAPGYTSVETRTFNRNERAYDFRLEMRPNLRTTYGTSHSNSRITIRTTDINGNVAYRPARSTTAGVFYDLVSETNRQMPLRVSADRSRVNNNGNDSLADTMRLGTRGEFAGNSWTANLVRATGFAPTSFAANSPKNDFKLFGIEAGINRRQSGSWTFDWQGSVNQAESGDRSGTGFRSDFRVNYNRDKLTVSTGWNAVDSGGLTNLGGFTGGSGLGLGESGFSGGLGNILTEATRSSRVSVDANYQPLTNLSVRGGVYQTFTRGSVSSNSKTTGYLLSTDATWGRQQMTLSVDQSQTEFIGSSTTSRATSISAGLQGEFSRRLSYSLRASSLQTGGTSQFRQNGGYVEGGLSYLLTPRESINFDFALGSSTGNFAQEDRSLGLFYGYRIIENARLNVGYRYRNVINRDPDVTSGQYRFSGLDLELSFVF